MGKIDGGMGGESKHSLVSTEGAARGDSHEGPKLLGCPGRGDDHVELKDGEEVKTFMGEREK